MIKVKDGYAKLIGTTYLGSSSRVLLSNGGDHVLGNASGNIPLSNGTVNTNLNADTVDGLHIHTGRNSEANKLVRTDASGYILAGWINTTSGNFTGTPDRIYASNDAYVRYMTPANFLAKVVGNNYWKVNNQTTAGSGDIYLEFWRGTNASWKILNTGGVLKFQSNYVSSAGDYYDAFTITYDSGNVWAKGNITAAKFIGTLNNTLTFLAGKFTAKTYNNSAAVTVNIPTHTSHLTNNSGFLTLHQSLANYVTLNTALTISGVKTFSTLLKFTVTTGTSPFTVSSTTKVTNLNADRVDDYHISTAGTTKPWGTIVTIGSDGVSEMGRYIDFHYDNTTGSDYSTRLLCGGNHSNVVTLPSATGTLALTSQIPSVTNYYWANVKVSSSSSTTTTPTFATATVSGTTTTKNLVISGANQYRESGGIILSNSDIWGLNAIYTLDLADAATEGYLFKRTNGNYDSIWCKDGVFYFSPNGNNTDGYSINTNILKAIKSITRSGTTFTYTCLDGTTGTFTLQDNNSTYAVYGKTIDASYKTAYRTQTGRASGYYLAAIRCDTASVAEAPQYGSGIAFGMADTHGYLYMNYSSANAYIGAGNADKLNWTATLLHSSNSSVSGGGSSWGSSITVKINGTSKTLTIPSAPSISITNSKSGNAVTNISASGHTLTVTKGSFASVGSLAFTPANTELTPALVLALTGEWSIKKGTWDYSGNGYIVAGSFGNIDLAGTSVLTFGNSSAYTQLYITAPTQSGHSGKTNEIFFYNDHGSNYSPGWTRIITNRNYTDYVNTTNFPGLNKTGTITAVTAGAGLSGGGTSGNVTITNAGVRSTTINGNYLRVNTNGTNTDLTIPYATTASLLSNTSISDPSKAASGLYLKWYSLVSQASGYAGTNYGFPVSNNANGILWLGTHSGPYGWQMGFSSNGRIYARYISNNTFSTTANGGSWKTIAWTTDTAPSVTVTNSDSNSTYRMVWHSGNNLYSTAGIYCNPSTDYLYASSMQTNNWFRSTGSTGWYSQDYGGGWYMSDSTWIRTYGSKSIYQNTGTLRTDGTLLVGSDGAYLNWNSSGGKMMNRVIIDSSGRISPNATGVRRAGMYGIYDSYKIGHIWSMGTAYMIPDNGSTFGNLYGLAYKHTNNTTGGTMASGHMMVWCQNGTPYCALGTNMWTSGNSYAAHFYENSDINLKTNIEAIATSDNIPQLKEFDWKSDGSHSYGLIALELEKMGYSELVDNSGEHKTVNYSAALSLIVGKLQVKIKELEKEIEILKNKN